MKARAGPQPQNVHAPDVTKQIAESEERRKYANERGFETVKQLTTLAAGSVVVLATFLGDIFPKTRRGVLIIGGDTKVFISVAFLCLVVSLVTSCYFMYQFASAMNRPYDLTPLTREQWDELQQLEERYYEAEEKGIRFSGDWDQVRRERLLNLALEKTQTNVRRSYQLPFLSFVAGIFFLSIAVVLNMV
jgi:hypothetical protein